MRAIHWMRSHLASTIGVIVVLLAIGAIDDVVTALQTPTPSPAASALAAAPGSTPAPSPTTVAKVTPTPTNDAAGCYFIAPLNGVNVEVTVNADQATCATLSFPGESRTTIAPTGPAECSTTINGYSISVTNDDPAGDMCAGFAALSPTPVADAPSPTPGPCDPSVTYCDFKPRVLLNKSSSDSHIIGWKLPAADDSAIVDLHYAYRCSGSGNFIINTYDGSYFGDDPFYVNELDSRGSGTVEDVDESAGETRIQVISECSWTIKVTAKPDPDLVGISY